MQKILVVDDDRDMCLLLKRFLETRGFHVSLAFNSKQALELLELTEPHLVLCDFRLDNNNGKTMLLRIREIYPALPVIIITGYSDVKIAAEVMKLGAYDYITKPIFPEEIIRSINSAIHQPARSVAEPMFAGVNAENFDIDDQETEPIYLFENSQTLDRINGQINELAQHCKNVVIQGESGIGKEVIAREIHKRSTRCSKAFVSVNCGAMSKEAIGSELFGHEKGSFNGAIQQKTGNFELAHGGTIFLDEIANLSHEIQISLLRLLDEKKIRRVGGIKNIELDVRVIVANNERLSETSRKGRFREDLLQRLEETTIDVPPLRDRKEEIMMFARHFLRQLNRQLGKNISGFSDEVEDIFKRYRWYGNLRELKNVVKRAILLTDGDFIQDRSLPFEICNFTKLLFEPEIAEKKTSDKLPEIITNSSIPRTLLHENSLKEVSIDAEYEMILEALKQTNFNKSKAARYLNIDRKTLYNKMKQYQQLNNY